MDFCVGECTSGWSSSPAQSSRVRDRNGQFFLIYMMCGRTLDVCQRVGGRLR